MAFTFPASPATNDTYTVGSRTYTWTGSFWEMTGGLITTSQLTDLGVTTAKIAADAVTEAKIGAGSVTQAKLTSGLSGITVTTTANRSAVIPSPFSGQFIFLTDTSQLQRWDGSSWVVALTTVPTGAPTSLAVSGSPTTNTVTLTFSAGADGGSAITNYQYALSTDSGSTYGSYTALSPADASSPITITGLSMGTAYYVKLKAVNALGTGLSESSALSFSTANLSVEYLIIAGGGGSGGQRGAGGGAGGYRTNVSGATSGGGSSAEASMLVGTGTYAITVGAGGAGAVFSFGGTATNGYNSIFNSITSTGGGGGRGGLNNNSGSGASGGSGGGSSGNPPSPGFVANGSGTGTANQGYNGGRGYSDNASFTSAGGGGGAGSVGTDASSVGGGAGNGGAGVASSITGSSITRGGGGGGGGDGTPPAGSGGSGGGGAGNASGTTGTAGTANTGGGAGGSGTSSANGVSGGSGVVIVRYLTADVATATITGGTATTSGSYTVRTFLASGSLVIA